MVASEQLPTTDGGHEKKQTELLLTAASISLTLHLFIGLLGVHFFRGQPVLLPSRPFEFSLVILTEPASAPRPQETGTLPRSRPAPKPKPVGRPQPAPVVEPLALPIKTESNPDIASHEKLQERLNSLPDVEVDTVPSVPLSSIPADTGSLTNSSGEGLPVIAPIYDADYLSNPVPPYPPAAKRLKLQGTVIVRVLVNPDGKPESANLQKSSGASMLDEAAMNAVKHWSFVPARQGDTPIPAWVDVPILFRLK